MAKAKEVASDLAPEPVAPAQDDLSTLALKLLDGLGVISGNLKDKVQEIADHAPHNAQVDEVVSKLNQAITPQHYLAFLKGAAAGLLDLAKTGKSVTSHADSDLS